MRRWIAVIALVLLTAGIGLTQEKRVVQKIFGPRVGVTYMVIDPDEFDENMREVFRADAEGDYFPVFTQFGIHVEQRIPLGGTAHHFLFQEILLLGGLDQSVALPSASFLIGFRAGAGFEIGLGPNASLARTDGDLSVGLSVAYGIGWTFTFEDVHVPVNLAVVPTPKDGHPRFTLLTGFNFNVR